MANKAREEWEKLKSGGKSSYTGGVTPSGNAARDRWNSLKTTMSRPSSALEKPVVDREEGDANGYMTEWQRKQELKRLKREYSFYEPVNMQGIADNRSWEEIYAENEKRNEISHRIKMLESQLRTNDAEDYYKSVLERMGKLDEETVGYLDQLNAGMPKETGPEMQGVADNRSWEERYAEQQEWESAIMAQLAQKGYSAEQIAQMRKDRERQVNRENYKAEVAESTKEAQENGFLASVKSIPQNLTGGLGTLSLAAQNAHRRLTGDDTPVDYYTPEMVGQAKAQAARQTVSKRLESNTELSTALTGNVAAFLYNTGMSMADSAAVAGMAALGVPPAAGTALLGGSAATQAAREAKERGVSDEQALWTGLTAGAAEMIFEKISLDRLLSTSPTEGVLRERLIQAAKNIGKQSLTEGSEELFTSVANSITDAVINGEQSAYKQSIYNYMMQGMEYGEAVQAATKDWASSLAQDFLAGAISGGTMGGVATEVGNAFANMDANAFVREQYGNDPQVLVDRALEADANNKTAQIASKRLKDGKKLDSGTLRSLVMQTARAKITADGAEATPEAVLSAAVDQMVEDAKARKNASAYSEETATSRTDFTEEEARYIVEEGAKEFGNAASSVVNSYVRGQDPQMYMAQAKLAFNYGKTMSEEKGLPYALNSPALKSLDETQIRSLFNAGRMQAKSIPVSAVKGTGKAVLTDGLDYSLLSPAQQKQYNALASFAKATGYTIEFFESKVGEDGRYTKEQGRFDPSTGVIRIDINAGRNKVTDLTNYAMVRVASHEITHSFKKNAPQQYVALRDYVTGVLADKGKFDDLVDTKMRDLGIDHETAVDEVVADGCEMMLRDTRFINNLAKENRTLFEKIRDAIRKFVKKIRDAFEGVEIAHKEAALLKDAENLQKLWDEALAKSVENVAAAEETTTESAGEVKKSMRAATKEDPVAEAERMEKGGATRDEIFKATGLIRDASGCWVAEMDDSQMKIFPKGDALLANNPEYQRYMELAREGDFFSAEFQELAKKFKKSGGKKTLEQFVQYDELFRRFPEMRNVEFLFRDLGGSSRGYWSAAANAIVLDESLKKGVNQNELSRVAIHEIQHALQHFEKRATGSSVEYWEEKKAQGYKRGKNDKKIKDADAAYRKLFDAAPEDVKRVVREINRAYLAKDYDRAAELADGMAGTEHEDVFWAIDEADFTRRMLRDSNEELTARELYLDTAGEIEARTTASRVGMSAEQRREKAPDLGWDRAVFADNSGDVMYSKRDYSYAALTSKPDMTVTAVREETQYDRKTVVENALKSVASVGRRTENGNAVIKVRDIGKDVVVTKRSLVHGLDRRLNVQAPVLENVGSVLQNAIRINELTPRRDDVESTYVLVGAARGTKGMYIASFVVNSITDEVTTVDVLYALNAKKESAALLPKFTDESATPTDSVISVANLLDYVNQYFPDILPEDVLKHYGHDERPAGKLGADALFSFRTGYIPTDRSILTSYAPKDSDSDMVKRHIAEYQKNVEELRKLEQTLREQREQMRGLAGDENKMRRAMLRDEIIKTQNRIQIASDQLLRKEKWMGVRTVLNREKDALVKQARAEEREKLKKYREQRWDTESRRKLRERITYRVKTLDKMLRNPTDDKHIPDGLQSAILDFCEAFTENTTVFPKKRLDSIRAEYAALESKVSETSLADLYDESIKEMLEYLGEVMSGKRLSELNVEQLNMVKAIADHFAFMVKNENEIFVQGRKVKLDETAQGVIFDAKGSGKDAMHLSENKKGFVKFMTSGNMKPIYRFRNMGDGIKGLFQSLLDAEYEYGKRMRLSERFVAETKKATGYREWSNTDKVLEFTNAAGQQVSLTLQQAMSLLATYEREIRHPNGLKHVTAGGFVYEKNVTATKKVAGIPVKVDVQSEAGKAHPMSVEDMDKVRTWLGEIDPRVLDYMGKMVEYLSTTMSEYGNETSMQLYGYKKFGEGYYWPIKSSEEFLRDEPGKAGFDESRWKHKGFTKATVKGALNPFVLRDFDDVFKNHVSQMLMYSTMAVPQDAFVRVMNYKTQVDPTGSTESVSVKSAIKSGYGNDALSYIDTLLSDVNGGVVGDPRGTPLDRFVSMYKKNAVSLSMSVVVQQYSAVVRAMSLIKSKYFRKTMNPVEMFKAFERAKEHSGVAVIKEIGGFDTSMGRSGADWLMEDNPGGKFRDAKSFSERKRIALEKGKALVQFGEKDIGYRDRVIGVLPAIADKVGWGHIWIAAENEIADTTDLERGTDAFYEAVAKRFEEVIELTQVYDSVLTRSENMRSKHAHVKAATSFMGEPTVVLNMVASAIADAKAGKEGAREKLGAVIGAVFFSIILNNFLKAFATAPRDKDEDQTIAEKWLEDFVGGTANDLFFANYLPVARDVVSAWSGYSVDATWFAPFEGLTNGVKGLLKDGEWHWDAAPDFINGVSAFYGLPVKNITRDLAGFYNIFAKSASLDETSARGFWNAFRNGMGWMPGVDDAMEKALNADRRGNDAQRKKALEELAKLYEDKAKQFRLEGKEDAAKKAKSSLKSSITAYLKPLYQAAKTQAEKNRIKSLALRVYVGGQQLYSGYDFERYWGEE